MTERLTLDPVTVDNAAILWRVMQGAQLRQYQDVPKLAQNEFVKRVAARPRQFDGRAIGRFEWLLFVTPSPFAIGWVSLRITDHGKSVAEIGYSLSTPARGKGYATEAVRAVVEVAFADGGMIRVDACCVPENTASRRLLEAIGFTQVRIQQNGAVVRGRPVDVCLYEMTRQDWQGLNVSSRRA